MLWRSVKKKVLSKKIQLSPRRELKRKMRKNKVSKAKKIKSRKSRRKKKRKRRNNLMRLLRTKEEKLSASSLRSTPFLWLLSNLTEDSTMTAQIWQLSDTDCRPSNPIELSTSPTWDKESTLKWSLLLRKRWDGSPPKDVNTWDSELFLAKTERNSKQDPVYLLDCLTCSMKLKIKLWIS